MTHAVGRETVKDDGEGAGLDLLVEVCVGDGS